MTTQEQVRDAWDNIATGYDQFATPLARSLAEDVLGRVGLRPGERLLDVAAGTGALSLPAARFGAQVLATDIAPAMIECLEARARAEGLTNIEGRVMDGHALERQEMTGAGLDDVHVETATWGMEFRHRCEVKN